MKSLPEFRLRQKKKRKKKKIIQQNKSKVKL